MYPGVVNVLVERASTEWLGFPQLESVVWCILVVRTHCVRARMCATEDVTVAIPGV